MSMLAMFGLFRAAKFWVALVMAAVQFVHAYWGIDLGLDEATITAILGGIGALLVWWIPNLKGKDDDRRSKFPPAPPSSGGLY